MDTLSLTIKDVLKLAISPVKGVKPAFNMYHIIKTLILLHERGPLGRQLLSKHLGIGVTSTRTLIKRLKSLNLLDVDPVAGCILTNHGRRIVDKILSLVVRGGDVKDVLDPPLMLYKKAYAFLVKRGVEMLKKYDITYIRDTVIKHEARAVIIVYIVNGKIYIPPERDLNEERYPSLRRLTDTLGARDLDAIFVIFVDEENLAEKTLFYTLLDLNML